MSNTPIFINEIHYNNFGIDVAEGIEIAGPAGTNLAGWSLHLYEGGSGKSYKVYNLKGLIPNLSSGFGVLFFHTPGIKNGKNDKGDGIAFVDKAGKVAQFISYGGKTGFKAEDGPATNLSSSRLPFEETEFSSWTDSLQLAGTGCFYEDFHWNKPSSSSKGRINREQKFVARPTPAAPSNENAPEPVSQPSNPIQVTIDPKTEQNRTKHWTSKYHTEDMFVVRRGFSFEISVSSAEDLIPADVSIVLTSHPDTDRTMTLKVLDTLHSVANPQWNAFLDPDSKNQTKRNLDISIGIPPDAIIGEYSMSVDIKGTSTRFPAGPVIVLFNPWSDRDTVFMADQSWREEYILNETGFIWVGTELNSSPRAWNFAQFDTKSLLAALSLVEKIPRKERKDSVLVARRMSALCNASHDDGVLVGNWSGNFEGGTRPTAWSGSAEILKQYYLTKQPVKYGQCWVFSGVVTAVCRSIGIPTRSITNFASAHDTGFDRNIDKYYKRDNHEVDDSKTSDSIWNFHVWNDVWMRRPDLNNPENDGWQAIDATPQELSEGTYQTGPVSLNAIKNGAKDAKYDGEFVFSEVNADVREFVENEDGTDYILVQTYSNAVGKKISTKAVGSGNREDITLQYKYAEGSVEERIAFGESNTNLPEDVFLSLAAETVTMDKPVQAVLTLKKTAPQPRTVRVIFSAQFVHYTGRGRQQLSSLTQNVVLDSESKSITLAINPNEYQNSLNANRTITFRAFISVSETKQVGLVSRTFEFTEPPINFSLPQGNKIKLGQTAKITVKFSNPLSIPLTRAVLSVEGQNLTKVQRFRFESIPAKGDLQYEVEIQGWAVGKNWLIATFECDQLTDIEDHIEVLTEK